MVEINVVGGFDAALENKFNKDIANLKRGDVAIFNITSHGGEVDVLKRMTAKVYGLKQKGVQIVTFVPDYAESAGFFFFLLGDHREIDPSASVHYHAPRITVDKDTTVTKNNLSDLLSDMTAYQDFTSGLFREACEIDEDIFALIENSELPMNRSHLQTLGIIN